MSPNDTSYEYWDMRRRENFPDAQHTHWESFMPVTGVQEVYEPVAEWNPHTGRCWIGEG